MFTLYLLIILATSLCYFLLKRCTADNFITAVRYFKIVTKQTGRWRAKVSSADFKLEPLSTEYLFRPTKESVVEYARLFKTKLVGNARGDIPILFPEATAISSTLIDLFIDAHYPFPILGTVHARNEAILYRPIMMDSTQDLEELIMCITILPDVKSVKPGTEVKAQFKLYEKKAHSGPFDLSAKGSLVWECLSSFLVRHKQTKTELELPPKSVSDIDTNLPETSTYTLPLREYIGRKYAGIAGDMNPIHLYAFTAKLFGFKRAVAHGMYVAASIFELIFQSTDKDSEDPQLLFPIKTTINFKKPAFLPSTIAVLTTKNSATNTIEFQAKTGATIIVDGSVEYKFAQ